MEILSKSIMNTTIIKRKEKVEKLQSDFETKFKAKRAAFGKIVSTISLAPIHPFQKLDCAIGSSNRRRDFLGQYYYVQTRDHHIQKLVPISENYRMSFLVLPTSYSI
jgi:hypothetical protein